MTGRITYKLYCCLMYLGAAVVGPLFALHPRGRVRLAERFGFWKFGEQDVPTAGGVLEFDYWFHGASVGEVSGMLPVIGAIRSREPKCRMLLTATSPTAFGNSKVLALCDEYHLLPFDAIWCLRPILKRVRTKRFILTETELWPSLLTALASSNVKIFMINGRISTYTARRYQAFKALFKPLLSSMHGVCCESKRSADLLLDLGVSPERLHVTGNSKFDVPEKVFSPDEKLALRERLFPGVSADTPIVVLGSVHPTEEGMWLTACGSVWKSSGSDLRLVITPRHLEKLPYFSQILSQSDFQVASFSGNIGVATKDTQILVLDQMGVLSDVYAVAAVAFIGGTLVDIGGHNPLEAARYGTPICVGPYCSVIESIVDEMGSSNGVVRLSNQDSVTDLVNKIVEGRPELQTIGDNGRLVSERQRGATKRILEVLL